jgi:excisionase family DNA binding protein
MIYKEIKDYPPILTAHEICEILKVSKPTAYELMKRNDFPLIEIGKCKRVTRDDFIKWLGQMSRKNKRMNQDY